MDSDYKSKVKLNFINGDVKIEVSNGKETFSFISGLGFIALPHFFDTLTKLYNGDIKREKLFCCPLKNNICFLDKSPSNYNFVS